MSYTYDRRSKEGGYTGVEEPEGLYERFFHKSKVEAAIKKSISDDGHEVLPDEYKKWLDSMGLHHLPKTSFKVETSVSFGTDDWDAFKHEWNIPFKGVAKVSFDLHPELLAKLEADRKAPDKAVEDFFNYADWPADHEGWVANGELHISDWEILESGVRTQVHRTKCEYILPFRGWGVVGYGQ